MDREREDFYLRAVLEVLRVVVAALAGYLGGGA